MDSVKKQLRFFRVLIAVLVIVVAAQFSFLFKVFGTSSDTEHSYLKKVRVLEQPRKVIDPAVSAAIKWVFN